MSLIQQALEKTSREQETRTRTPPPAPKIYDRDPMGAALERELTQVQHSYAKRRGLYWKVALGAFTVCLIAGLFYIGLHGKNLPSAAVGTKTVPQVPVQIFSGYIYRLTGITNIGDKTIAVINNRLVGVGDTLNNKAVVKAIGKSEVRLDIQGKEITLTL